MLLIFPIISFWIEILASKKWMSRYILFALIVLNLVGLFLFPIVMSYKIESHPLMAMYLMMFATGTFLKLVSFHHVYHDNRNMMKRLIAEPDNKNPFGLPKEINDEALRYPNNLNF